MSTSCHRSSANATPSDFRLTHYQKVSLLDFTLVRIVLAILVGLVVLASWRAVSDEHLQKFGDTRPTELAVGTDLHVPMSRLKDGVILLFEYSDRARTRFVVTKALNREIEVALAECPYCYHQSAEPNVVLSGKVICGRCKGPMPIPESARTGSQPTCELLRIPYHTHGNEIVIASDAVVAELQELSHPNHVVKK
jgi:uncharacterized membrane protein